MCVFSKPKIPTPAAAPIIANPGNEEASQRSRIEAMRRRRAGAAASILTGARGIPSTSQLGDPA